MGYFLKLQLLLKSVTILYVRITNGVYQMNRKFLSIILLMLVLVSSCSNGPSLVVNPEVLPTVTPPPQPTVGNATISGQVIHQDGSTFGDIIVRLAEVERGVEGRGGAYILDLARSPGTITDGNGYFTIQNIQAGEYVIVVGDIELTGIYEIIQEPDGKTKVWTFPADQITDIGKITVRITLPTTVPTIESGAYPAPTIYPAP